MKTFTIPQGAEGFLIVQEKNKNVERQAWTTRKELAYSETYVQVDPERIKTFGKLAYEGGSMAQKLALDGYYVFSSVENEASAYLLAIKREDITIS